jgi:DNA-binding transcriptional LysR family regulator
MPTSRLHLVVRRDLPPGDQAVQAAHALRQFTAEHPDIDRQWFEQSNTLALLAAPDERTLARMLDRAFDLGIRAAAFREPDLGGSLTAIAIEPAGARLCRGLPLALRA